MKKILMIFFVMMSFLTSFSCDNEEKKTDEKNEKEPLNWFVFFTPSSWDIVPPEGDTLDIEIQPRPASIVRITTIFDNIAYFKTESNWDSLIQASKRPDYDISKFEQELESQFLKVHVHDGNKMNIVVYPLDTLSRAWHAITTDGGSFFIKQDTKNSKWE